MAVYITTICFQDVLMEWSFFPNQVAHAHTHTHTHTHIYKNKHLMLYVTDAYDIFG